MLDFVTSYLLYCVLLFVVGLKFLATSTTTVDHPADADPLVQAYRYIVWDLPLSQSYSGAQLIHTRDAGTAAAWTQFVVFLLLLPFSPVGALWNFAKASVYTTVGKLITSGAPWHLFENVNHTGLDGMAFFHGLGVVYPTVGEAAPITPTEANKNQ